MSERPNDNLNKALLPGAAAAAVLLSVLYVALAVLDPGPKAHPGIADAPEAVEAPVREISKIDIPKQPEGEAYLSILPQDSMSLPDRYDLPDLSRMSEEDQEKLVKPLQAIRRMDVLGIDEEDLEYPEAGYKVLYNDVLLELEQTVPGAFSAGKAAEEGEKADHSGTADEVAFTGDSASDLNALLEKSTGKTVSVESPSIVVDETILVPSGVCLKGNGVKLLPDEGAGDVLDRAVLLNRISGSSVSGLVIEGGFRYGIYVKHSDHFLLEDNDISGVEIKGITVMGHNEVFRIRGNALHDNKDGGLYLDGDISRGIIEENRVENNQGAANLSAGIVLSSIDIKDEDTAWNPWEDIYIYDMTVSPHELVVMNNTIRANRSSGCYSHAGYCNYFVQNRILQNEKEGMCLDYGSLGNFVAFNVIRGNGGRYRMTDADLERDFIGAFGRLEDGSSPAKLPGLSMDNSAYNFIYQNIVAENYGSGIKAVRSSYRNTILCNEITDNNQGVSDSFHFFGVELATDMNADEEVKGLDFTPCYENIVARNTISGAHFSGIFYGVDAYVNDSFDNVIMGATDWTVELLSDKFNSIVNNH